jgi:release factor glutamine methyltransferase
MASHQFDPAQSIDVIPAKAGIHLAVTVADAMKFAQQQIDPVDARVLLQHTLKANRAHLAAHPEKELPPAQQAQFYALIARRKNGEPVAYIIGEREFFGLTFHVTPAVLIPRPETELLVEQALARIPEHRPIRILDLGSGSGVIAIIIAKHRPLAEITAVDASENALRVAKENAQSLLSDRAASITFIQSDWFHAVPNEPFDIIVSNPPYVADDDAHLAHGDLRFEPRQALAAGPRGLSALEHIARNAASRLAPGGWLLLEHGYDQREACVEFMHSAGFSNIVTLRDLAGIDRVTLGQLPIE